jgi:hypothetical protein
MGGNSTKATSGINGAGTQTQQELGIPDSAKTFFEDTKRSVSIISLSYLGLKVVESEGNESGEVHDALGIQPVKVKCHKFRYAVAVFVHLRSAPSLYAATCRKCTLSIFCAR